ncbi:hypothetical protein YC2023_110916 [Brassica napus]
MSLTGELGSLALLLYLRTDYDSRFESSSRSTKIIDTLWHGLCLETRKQEYKKFRNKQKHSQCPFVHCEPSEITAQPLVTKQKNRSHFYEYSPSKSSESSEMLEVVWTTEV